MGMTSFSTLLTQCVEEISSPKMLPTSLKNQTKFFRAVMLLSLFQTIPKLDLWCMLTDLMSAHTWVSKDSTTNSSLRLRKADHSTATITQPIQSIRLVSKLVPSPNLLPRIPNQRKKVLAMLSLLQLLLFLPLLVLLLCTLQCIMSKKETQKENKLNSKKSKPSS